MIKSGRTIKLTAGPDINVLPADMEKIPHRARLEYDPEGDTVHIDAGSSGIATKHGSDMRCKGTITKECAYSLLEILQAMFNGHYE